MLKMCNKVDEGGEEGVRYPVESSSGGGGGRGDTRHAGRRGEKPEVAPSRRVVHARREKRPVRRRWFKGL